MELTAKDFTVFPARAGMSPVEFVPKNWGAGVPRASGDEPAWKP